MDQLTEEGNFAPADVQAAERQAWQERKRKHLPESTLQNIAAELNVNPNTPEGKTELRAILQEMMELVG